MQHLMTLLSISNLSFSCFTPALLEISPVERGVVTLYGVRSGLFVAMNDKGKLYGSVRTFNCCRCCTRGLVMHAVSWSKALHSYVHAVTSTSHCSLTFVINLISGNVFETSGIMLNATVFMLSIKP